MVERTEKCFRMGVVTDDANDRLLHSCHYGLGASEDTLSFRPDVNGLVKKLEVFMLCRLTFICFHLCSFMPMWLHISFIVI